MFPLALLAACGRGAPRAARVQSTAGSTSIADSTVVSQPGAPQPGEWTLPGRDCANTRYSPLAQITPQNVRNLRVAWTFSTGIPRGHKVSRW